MPSDNLSPDTTGLRNALAAGEISVSEVIEAALARAGIQDRSNILVSVDADSARQSAAHADNRIRSQESTLPLLGVPFVVKDNIDCLGWSTTCCTDSMRGFMPTRTAPVVRKLLEAGAILIGKAGLHELASGVTSVYPDAPARNIINPCTPSLMAGGSSSGTAAAIAGGIVPFGLGTDTGGSLRIPAACCGVYGFRPSCHVPSGSVRYSREGLFPVSPRHDTPGPMARSVRDLVLLDRILAGLPAEPLKPETGSLRIGLPEPFWRGVEPEIACVIEKLITALEARGHRFVPVRLPELFALNRRVSPVINIYDPVWAIRTYFAENGCDAPSLEKLYDEIADPCARALFADTLISHADDRYRAALQVHSPAMTQLFAEEMDDVCADILLYPTIALKPWAVNEYMPDETELAGEKLRLFEAYIRNTTPVSSAGMPAVTLPLRTEDNVPVGVELCARIGDDARLLQIALTVEAALHQGSASGQTEKN